MKVADELRRWRLTIASERGPNDHTLRLVLLGLAVLMERANTTLLQVSYAELTEATALGRSWLVRMLTKAAATGWVRREHGHTWGEGVTAYFYSPGDGRVFHAEQKRHVFGVRI